MISVKKLYRSISIACVVLSAGFLVGLSAQAKVSAAKERVRMKLYYAKNDAGERIFTIALTAGSGKNMHGLKNVEVVLSSILNDSIITLATLETDTLGEIKLYLAEDYVLPSDEDGVSTIMAEYAGDDEYRSADGELTISDLDFEFSFEEIDSVKYLKILATRLDGSGNKLPVEELNINIGVQRLFSILPIDEIETDADGYGELEISNDIPGDAEGLLNFVARIEDHDEFGTVIKKGSSNWGVPVSYEVKPLPRQLFTDEAPLWMIISVFVILLGAWYHFFLSISKLIKLKNVD
jgi:hypothetical protein